MALEKTSSGTSVATAVGKKDSVTNAVARTASGTSMKTAAAKTSSQTNTAVRKTGSSTSLAKTAVGKTSSQTNTAIPKTGSSTSLAKTAVAKTASQVNTAVAAKTPAKEGTSVRSTKTAAKATSAKTAVSMASTVVATATAGKTDSSVKTAVPKSGKAPVAPVKTDKKSGVEASESKASTVADPRIARFNVCLLTMATMLVGQLLAHSLAASSSSLSRLIGSALCLFMAFFALEWTRIHSRALTRIRRAYFDEANVLETYQPRARTMGHLFKPDPPTPGVTFGNTDANGEKHTTDGAASEFNNARDSHYANMYQFAVQQAKEMEAMQASGLEIESTPSEKETISSANKALAEKKKQQMDSKKQTSSSTSVKKTA